MGKDRNDSDQQLQDSLSELSNPNIISTHNSDSDPLNPPKHNPSDSDNDTRKRVKKKQRPRYSSPESDSDSDSDSREGSRKRGRRKRRDSDSDSDSGEGSRKRGRRKRRVRDSSSESDSEEESGKRGRRRRRVRDSSSESDSEEESRKRGRRRREILSESDSGDDRRKRGKRKSRRRDSSSERRKRRKREKEERERKREKEKKKKRRKKEKKERGKKGAVTNSWGKYGIVKETDMWNKRPEFTAWLAEVKQVNLEALSNWEEKKMFKEYMEDYNTATFPSKRYYNLDAYYRRQMEKEQRKGFTKALGTVRTVFNDEEQRRQELLIEREKQKEQEVEALKHSMQSGLAQAMKEQQRLREEMAYQYKIGNFEAAAAIQRRLDPDAAM